jgi:hypothetical protein
MDKIKFFFLLLFMMIVCGCSNQGKIQHAIIKKIEDCDAGSKCVVDLRTLTDFEWDTVYFSSSIPRIENVEKAIGLRYDFYEEFTHPIIFIKEHRIVYYENCKGSVEGIVKNQIFIKSESGSFISGVFTAQTAFFIGSVGGSKGSKYYILAAKGK